MPRKPLTPLTPEQLELRRERSRDAMRRYRAAGKERRDKEGARAYRLRNADKRRESARRYREQHADELAQTKREWKRRNPHLVRASDKRYLIHRKQKAKTSIARVISGNELYAAIAAVVPRGLEYYRART
jgi:hypothetical protein